MGEQQHYAILIYELVRRLSNIHGRIPFEERLLKVEHYIKKQKTSGYSRTQARQGIVSGLLGFVRKES